MAFGYEEAISVTQNITKYLIHGLVLLGTSWLIFWLFLLSFLWPWYLFLSLTVTIISCIAFVVGLINMIVTEYIWGITGNSSVENWIVQGIIILIPTQLLMMSFYSFLLTIYIMPEISLKLILITIIFLAYFAAFDFIGAKVGSKYQEIHAPPEGLIEKTPARFRETKGRCPKCGESFRYSSHDFSPASTVRCLNCHNEFYLESDDLLLRKVEDSGDRTN